MWNLVDSNTNTHTHYQNGTRSHTQMHIEREIDWNDMREREIKKTEPIGFEEK